MCSKALAESSDANVKAFRLTKILAQYRATAGKYCQLLKASCASYVLGLVRLLCAGDVCSTVVLLQHIASNLERKIGLSGSLRQEGRMTYTKVFPSGKVSEGNAFVREYIGVFIA